MDALDLQGIPGEGRISVEGRQCDTQQIQTLSTFYLPGVNLLGLIYKHMTHDI